MVHWPSRTNSRFWFVLLGWTPEGQGYWSWVVHLNVRPRVWLIPWFFSRRYVRIGGLEYRSQP